MQITDYYIAARQPSKGGLHIKETSKHFPQDCLERLENEYLELIASDYEHHCCAVFPIGNDRFIVSMAMKTNGNHEERRPHEIIHGFLVSSEEFTELCRNSMAQGWFHQAFFPEIAKGQIELAGFGYYGTVEFQDNLGEFRRQMEGNNLIGFYNSLIEVIRRKAKIHLQVPPGTERIVQAACYDILPKELKSQLSVISNGECTMTDADILITQSIQYQDSKKYIQMDLRTFIEAGLRVKQNAPDVEKAKHVITAEGLVEECIGYIKNPYIPAQIINKVRRYMNSKPEFFEEVQLQLRYRLETLEVRAHELLEYVQVMCLAFENYQGAASKTPQPLLAAPYDLEGIVKFLETRCISKREQERYLQMFLDLQMDCYSHLISKKRIQKAKYKV